MRPSWRTIAAASVLALVLAAGATAGAPTYVPFGPYNIVSLQPTYAGVVGLNIKTPQWSYGAIQTRNWLGQTGLDVGSDGSLWSHANSSVNANGQANPRLRLQSVGYQGVDTLQALIAGSPVAVIEAGGTFTRYNYYDHGDHPAFAVEDAQDKLYGGIAGAGALITAQNSAPAASSMGNGEARVWFDPTPGTGGLRVTEKFSDGTVKTVSLG